MLDTITTTTKIFIILCLSQAPVIYTDGSKSDSGGMGNGVFVETSGRDFRRRFRNLDHSSVFCSELIGIKDLEPCSGIWCT
ncbi:hypothetical protein CEXT_237301 [Caerostris extrusa]|nr:hypothetical protein CEXT_237301 [Caerostris extrusa]